MPKFRLTGDYGTFTITQEVIVPDLATAWEMTGIMTDLEEVGWTFTAPPDGETWKVELEHPHGWVLLVASS